MWYSDKLDGNTTIIYLLSSDKEIFNFLSHLHYFNPNASLQNSLEHILLEVTPHSLKPKKERNYI